MCTENCSRASYRGLYDTTVAKSSIFSCSNEPSLRQKVVQIGTPQVMQIYLVCFIQDSQSSIGREFVAIIVTEDDKLL